MEGSLSKWTNVMKGWQYRWFVLDEYSGLLSYYTSKEKMMRGVRRGCVRLKGAVISIDDEDDSTFTITVDHKTFHFQARDGAEREKWVRALEETIFRHGNKMRWNSSSNGTLPTIKDFDNKVSEADAYLQLMIEQTSLLERRIESCEDDNEKLKYQCIFDHANIMLDDIKHSIVLLQIAKNTAHPINGLYPLTSTIPLLDSSNCPASDVSILDISGQSGVELGSECIENVRRHASIVGKVLSVPEMSYSSSEGEDDFFDANDSPFNTASQVTTPTSLRQFANSTVPSDDQQQPPISAHALRTSSTLGATEATSTTSACVSATGTVATSFSAQGKSSRGSFGHADSSASIGVADSEYDANDVDYDSLYDDDVEADVQLDAQGSVIKHLLSQVKIGMDLTKVVLPTFILERRSLLEMYADYFAHPDIFVKIADLQTPRDRMVQVVRWYLSSYHAGRKSSVAKKPYNPILGEVFRCHWEIPPVNRDVIASSELASDGPVPWSKRAHLSFVAEQVSHHPPISAFYAEQYDKRISFNAHIYTRSKFLGLSICVQNIGSGVVSLLDLDEHYEVTFPNGYGRSILTVPWIELGGPVEIRCEKTGYSCHIDFITKAFYSKHTHRIEAEVSGPKQPKFLTINGEWNGVMEAKWSDKEGAEEFIDVNRLAITTKQVRPISQQDENESRRLWRDVTAGLKINNIQKATDAKARLEAKQRIQAKERKESNVNWETKLFSKRPDDSWYYTKPLKQRLQSSNT